MNTTLAGQIVENMQQKPTEELLAIWTRNDREQWSEAAFEAISQTLSERGISVPPQVAFVSPPPPYKGVGGWLLLFCISVTMISPLIMLAQLRAVWNSERSLVELHTSLRLVAFLDIAVVAFGMYAGICLWRVAPGAVKKAKMFLWCKVAYFVAIPTFSTIVLVVARVPVNGTIITEAFMKVVFPLIGCAVWIAYFESSKRVRATYE